MAFVLRNRVSAPRLLALGAACALFISACTSEEDAPADAGVVTPGGGGFPIDATVPFTPPPQLPDASLPRPDAALPAPVDASTPVVGPDASLPKPDAAVLPAADGGISLPDLGDAGLDLGGLLGDGGLFGGGGNQSTPDSGVSAQCRGAICVDVFDCWIFYSGSCGFTACDFGTCK